MAGICSLRKPVHPLIGPTIGACNDPITNLDDSNMQTVQTYIQPLRNAISNPSSLMSRSGAAAESAAETAVNNPQTLVNRVRSMDSATMVSAGIVAAEAIGFFCVGEMIGRFKIVGYRGGHSHGEHH